MDKDREIQLLKEIVELQKSLIAELSKRPVFSPALAWPQAINTPFMRTVSCREQGGMCEYPFPWHSITPPPCKKCGMIENPGYTVTCSKGS
jgi:hypothetical protein